MNVTEQSKKIIDSCRFCWMCRHVCPIGNATGHERNTARARAIGCSLVIRGAEELPIVAENLYECTLCGACTNNCMTGWDPKVFIQELKTEALLGGAAPAYILPLVKNAVETGNVYGAALPENKAAGGALAFFPGEDALVKAPEAAQKAFGLVEGADFCTVPAGSGLYFLAGKTDETLAAMKRCAAVLNTYKTVVVYDPVDLKLFKHEYREWGVELTCKVVGFNEYLMDRIGAGKLHVKSSGRPYTLQDHFAYARDLDGADPARELIALAGENREMLLIKKEADCAGSLVMNEYMPAVMKAVAERRIDAALRMGAETIVTENPAEYVLMKQYAGNRVRVITVEEMILENQE